MLRGLFQRFFSQFREGGLIAAQFTIGASGAPTKVETNGQTSHNDLTLVRDSGGTYTLTLADGARNLQVIDLRVVALTDPTDVTDQRTCHLDALEIANTGVISFVTVTNDGTEAITDPLDGDRIHVCIYVGK